MFHLTKHPTKITSLNVRTETHGDEQFLAVDVGIEYAIPNTALTMFDKHLLDALYFKSSDQIRAQQKKAEDAPSLPGIDPEKPNLLCPNLAGPFKFEYDGVGFHAALSCGISGSIAKLALGDVKFNSHRLSPREGGTVAVTSRLQRSKIDPREIAQLSAMLNKIADMDLTPPEAEGYAQPAIAQDAADDDDDFPGEDPDTIPVTEPRKRGRKPAAKKAGKKPAATKRTARAFPAALDGTGDRDPFEAPAEGPLQ